MPLPTSAAASATGRTLRALRLVATLAALLAAAAAASVARADFVDGSEGAGTGLVGEIDLFQRLADAVGTVLQLTGRGILRHGDVFHSERSGPMAYAYRDAYKRTNLTKCDGPPDRQCNVAAAGVGTIGRVGYRFDSKDANLRGFSMQTQVGCVCLNTDCTLSLLLRPVEVEDTDGSRTGECLLVVNNDARKLVSCHTELLRITPNTDTTIPNPDTDPRAWNFSVVTASDWWVATGYRGGRPNITRAQFDAFPLFPRSIYSFHSDEVEDEVLFQVPVEEPAVTLYRGVTTAFPSQEPPCDFPFILAANGGSWIATQQDRHATGLEEATYISNKPVLVSDTELALVGSAAALGTLASFSILHRAESELLNAEIFGTAFERNKALASYTRTVILAIMAFFLEALPLQVALGQELGASRWVSELLHLDVTMAVNGDKADRRSITIGERVASNASVIVMTAMTGKVAYRSTRAALVAGLTAAFDSLFLLRLIWHSAKQIGLLTAVWKHHAERGREQEERGGDSENVPDLARPRKIASDFLHESQQSVTTSCFGKRDH